MTPREELLKIVRVGRDTPNLCSICDRWPKTHVRCHCGEIADAIIAAGYRKVEAGRDARETARAVIRSLKTRAYGTADATNELAGDFGSWAFLETEIATAITAAVEAQRERDARIVAAAIEMAEACKRAVPSESAADAEVTRYENARHRLQTVCAAAIREG